MRTETVKVRGGEASDLLEAATRTLGTDEVRSQDKGPLGLGWPRGWKWAWAWRERLQAGRVQEQQQHSRVANRAELRAGQGRKQRRTGLPVCLSSLFSALCSGWERHGQKG